jgi:hypothetical protein
MTFLESVWYYRLHITLLICALIALYIIVTYNNQLFGPKCELRKHNEYLLQGGIEIFLVSIKDPHRDLEYVRELLELYDLNFISCAELELLRRRSDLPRGISVATTTVEKVLLMHVEVRPPHVIVEIKREDIPLGDRFLRLAVTRQQTIGGKATKNPKISVEDESATATA